MADNKKLTGRPVIKKIKVTEEKKLKVIWTEVEGADKYAVLRKDEKNGEFVRVKWRTKLNFTDEVEENKTYWYKIKAVKELENKKKSTKDSGMMCAVLSDIEPPEKFKAKAENGTIVLTWNKDKEAKSYIVSRRNDFFSGQLPLAETKGASYTDEKIVSGQVYHYFVQSVYDDKKESKFSKKVSCVCLDSGKILSFKTFARKISFSLRLVAGADGYILLRKEKDGEYKEVLRTKSNLDTELSDKMPKHFKSYTYCIKAYKTVGKKEFTGPFSNEITVKSK